ncbi:hypothetical protein SEUCBS139899_000162 [Sporothrix eucalyptigena]|uniref:RRM domain-containing protein n=1 Tax=Sporothrix eucalyptigena TaxID=1812306 RepID=A0ABP0C685_9PEZI
MASSGPPGVNPPHPSLPARPPPSTVSAVPPSSTSITSANTSTYYGAAQPAAAAGPQQPKLGYSRTYAPVGGAAASDSSGYQANSYSYPQPQTASYGPQYGAQQYGPTPPTAGAGIGPQAYGPSAPHIQNPFPAQGPQQPPSYQQGYNSGGSAGAGRGGGSYRQNNNASTGYGNWQGAAATTGTASAASYGPSYGPSYGAGGYGANNYGSSYPGPATYGADSTETSAAPAVQETTTDADEKKKTHTVYRSGGGKTWTDDTLLEWDPNHPRLFVGNLAGEVTDDTLLKAFSKWRSVQKALVKRDKWTKKSRGYGFVSFSDADDFFQAAKEMNGKYIGSHPVVVRKSTTDIKAKTFKDESGGHDKYNKNRGKKNNYKKGEQQEASTGGSNSGTSTPLGASGSGASSSKPAYVPALGPVSSSVQKTKKKTKNGLKLLG